MVRRPSGFQNIIGDWHQYIGQLAIEHRWNMGGPTVSRPEWISCALHYANQHSNKNKNWIALCRAHSEYWDETLFQDLIGRIHWKSDVVAQCLAPSWLDNTEFARLHPLPGPRAMHSVWLHVHGLPSSKTDEKERCLQFEQLLNSQSLPTSILYPPTEFDALE